MAQSTRRPSNIELFDALDRLKTCAEVAKLYGVDKVTIQNWARKAGYKFPKYRVRQGHPWR